MDADRAAQLQRAAALLQAGDAATALHLAQPLAAAQPDDENAWALLGACQQRAGQMAAAVTTYTRLSALAPTRWQYWNALGNAQRALAADDAARAAYERALALAPQATAVRANLGLLLLNGGDVAAASAHLDAAAQAPDAQPSMRIWAAVAHFAAGRPERAAELLQGWSQWPRDSAEARLELGWLLGELGQSQAALAVLGEPYADGLALRAGARRVLLLERENRLDEAQLIAADLPADAPSAGSDVRQELLHAQARLAMRAARWTQARQALQTALALPGAVRGRRPLQFALAQVCDRLDDVPATLAALRDAHTPVPAMPASGWLAQLRQDWQAPAQGPPQDTADSARADAPVFIVGFPRSGTTLVEQMLAAHPAFASMDEQPLLLAAIARMQAAGLRYPHDLPRLPAQQRAQLRALYWQDAAQRVQRASGQRLVDKNPLNMLALPMLATLFPQAQVVLCRRHPCDVLLSCHLQAFADAELAALSPTLPRLAEAYAAFDAQFVQQSAALHVPPYVLRLEDLLADAPGQTQALAAWLGLDDAAPLLEYQVAARARGRIATPSYAQVIEPLQADRGARWLRYRAEFEPLLPLLVASAQRGGYAT